MVINMNENYLIIEQNVVINIVLWNGDINTWTPPTGSIWMPQATTSTKVWQQVNGQWELVDSIGNADIGFTWNGTECVTNQPKPELPQPAEDQPNTNGTQTL